MKSRNYCFTAFNKSEAENLWNWDKTKYIIIGEEICPNTKKLHYQGYIEITNNYTIKRLKKLAQTTHFEERRGDQSEAISYCQKDGKWYEKGSRSEQGKRTDLEELKTDLKSNMKLDEIADKHFSSFLKYNKGIIMYMNLKPKQRNWKTEVIIITGPPGCGKSKYVYENTNNAFWLPKMNHVWWDGYNNHEDVILDDFYGWIPYDLMLRLMDRYPLNIEIKGGSLSFLAKRIFITSNKQPREWYPNVTDEHWAAFQRRIDSHIDMSKNNGYSTVPNIFGTEVTLGNTETNVTNTIINITEIRENLGLTKKINHFKS